MLVSLNWLKQYVDYGDLTPEQLSEKITKSGIEVDGIHYFAEKSTNVVVGHVKTCEQHPNADNLSLCQVDVADEELTIACGAPNVAAGQKVAVAKPGAVLPGNFKIERTEIRDIASEGMICSLQELGVAEHLIPAEVADGIVVLPDDAVVGEEVTKILNLDDVILEFDLTPNRADALSMIGVAYEVAAILDKDIQLPNPEVTTTEENANDYISVHSEDPDLCPYYAAFIVKDVDIKPSPLWMQNYLLAAGVRPINNVVDITNYVLLEYGQPLHAFDYDILGSKEIVVRRAKEAETIVTLDDQTRELTTDNLLITNGQEGIAFAGVMGGANTEVSENTRTVLIEAAYFNPQTVRTAVNQTGLRSDASARFEKGVDPERVREAGLRACQLLVTYANGKLVDDAVEFNELTIQEKVLSVDAQAVNERLGTTISVEEMSDILRKLRFSHEVNGNELTIHVPTRRGDVVIFEDIVEEIGRIYGYDHLPYTLPKGSSRPGALSREQTIRRQVKNYLQGAGLMETITYSLSHKKNVKQLLSPDLQQQTYEPVKLSMPLSEDHEYLRLSLLPELLKTLSYNRARSQMNLGYYEMGSVFLSTEKQIKTQPDEQLRLAGVVTGEWLTHEWQKETKPVDFYVVKGIVEGLFNFLNIEVTYEQSALPDMHPGRCATLFVNKEPVGFLGQVHPSVTESYDLKETYVFDVQMERLLDLVKDDKMYKRVPLYPSIKRDIAFIVHQDVIAGDIQQTISELGAPLVKTVEIFDIYTGEPLKEDEQSIAYRLHFQDPTKTLKDAEVDELYEKIVKKINETYDAYVRS
ncbi:MAG TPA: phenylalanine--tRNA ligase subunit beta [Bacillota bacterium]|nr:phenylalanine--tRNA ligase subunit beta [Bacillota bacterium]